MGSLLTQIGLPGLAIKILDRAIELDPLNNISGAYVKRAHSFLTLGDYVRAENDYKKIFEIDSTYVGAFLWYFRMLVAMDRMDEAKKVLDKYTRHYGEHNTQDHKLMSAIFQIETGDTSQAQQVEFNYKPYTLIVNLHLQNRDYCLEFMENDFEERLKKQKRSWYIGLKHWPPYKFLHPDPRFQEILAKHKKLYEEILEKYKDLENLL